MARPPARLTEKLWVGLTPADRKRLRLTAARLGVPEGTLARALILEGLSRASGDPETRERVEREAAAVRARRERAGRTAADKRWRGGGATTGAD